MKLRAISVIIFVGAYLLSFNYYFIQPPKLTIITQDCDSIPIMNQQIIGFVNSKMNRKVGRGECWDLAAEVLNLIDAKWDGKYKYGRKVSYKTDCIFPGDIIQFEGVKVKYEKNGIKYKEKMRHHTAVIYEVKGVGNYTLAHQNTGFSGKKVGLSLLEIKNITKGKFIIYRPIKN